MGSLREADQRDWACTAESPMNMTRNESSRKLTEICRTFMAWDEWKMRSGASRLSRHFARVRDYRSINGVEKASFVKNLINLHSEVLGFLSAGILRYAGAHRARVVGKV